MTDTLQKRIQKRLNELGLTAEKASRAAGLDKTYLRKLFERGDTSPRGETLKSLAQVLGVTSTWLMDGGDDNLAPNRKAPELSAANVQTPPTHMMPNDVPVHGTAAASHLRGAFQLEAGVVDWVRRPPALNGASAAYALYIEGTSMEPRYQPGDLVFVHPNRPPRAGDMVIVQMEVAPNEIEASIGYLRRQTGEHVFLGKLNPDAEVQLKRASVKAIHRVLSLNDLFGV